MVTIELALIIIAAIWALGATISDYRTLEVPDYLNITLLIIALVVRGSYSIITENPTWITQGLIGLGIFYILGHAFYYGRIFGGGDAKMMIALGAIIGLREDTVSNIKLYITFIIIFLVIGAAYGIIYSTTKMLRDKKNIKKALKKEMKKNNKIIITGIIIGIITLIPIIIINEITLYLIPILIILTPLMIAGAKAYEKIYMIKRIKVKDLREGDVLTKDLIINNKKIKANFEGLTKKDLEKIRRTKKKTVEIKEGIPFTAVFLITIIIYYLSWKNKIGL